MTTYNGVNYPNCSLDDNDKIVDGVKTLRSFFDLKEGQALKDFGAELLKLSLEDKLQLVQGIRDGSLDYALASAGS